MGGLYRLVLLILCLWAVDAAVKSDVDKKSLQNTQDKGTKSDEKFHVNDFSFNDLSRLQGKIKDIKRLKKKQEKLQQRIDAENGVTKHAPEQSEGPVEASSVSSPSKPSADERMMQQKHEMTAPPVAEVEPPGPESPAQSHPEQKPNQPGASSSPSTVGAEAKFVQKQKGSGFQPAGKSANTMIPAVVEEDENAASGGASGSSNNGCNCNQATNGAGLPACCFQNAQNPQGNGAVNPMAQASIDPKSSFYAW